MTEEFRDEARLDANAVPEPGREEYLAQLNADERDDEALFGSEDKFIARYGKDWKGNTAPTTKPSPLGNNRPLGDPSAYRHIGSLTPSDADELQKQKTVAMGRSGPKHVVYDTAKGQITMADPEFAELESTKIMDRLHGGSSWRDWSGLVERQNAEKNREINDMLRKRSEFLQKSVADRKKIVAERNFNMADTGRLALDLLNRGEGEVKTDNNTGKRYLYVHVDPSRFEDIARQDAERGRRSSVGGMSAYVQIDDKGNPIGDPRFMLDVKKNNGDGAKDAKSIEPITLSQIMGQWAKSYATAFGASEADAQKAAVSEFKIGGKSLNPMKWAFPVTEDEKFAAQQQNAAADRRTKELVAKETRGGTGVEIARINAEQKALDREERAKRTRDRLATSIAKNMTDFKRGLNLNKQQAEAFQTSLTKILSDVLLEQPDDKAPSTPGDNTGNETATKKDGETAKEIEAARKALLATGRYKIDEETGKLVRK